MQKALLPRFGTNFLLFRCNFTFFCLPPRTIYEGEFHRKWRISINVLPFRSWSWVNYHKFVSAGTLNIIVIFNFTFQLLISAHFQSFSSSLVCVQNSTQKQTTAKSFSRCQNKMKFSSFHACWPVYMHRPFVAAGPRRVMIAWCGSVMRCRFHTAIFTFDVLLFYVEN